MLASDRDDSLFARIVKARDELECAERAYLVARGWTETCKNSRHVWLWTRTIRNAVYMCSRADALELQTLEDVRS